MTNAEIIRSMDDVALSQLLAGPAPWCIRSKECSDQLEADLLPPLEWCQQCVTRWLTSEAT